MRRRPLLDGLILDEGLSELAHMKLARKKLSARYLAALRTHLGQSGQSDGVIARRLGEIALAKGMIMRDVALMHQHAVATLTLPHHLATPSNGSVKRAAHFFFQAIIPLEAAQRATLEVNWNLKHINEALRLRNGVLARGNHHLEDEVTRRKTAEAVVQQGKTEYQKLLAESQVMQKKLRLLTRQIISAQEEERKEISRELHDEVVQTLVGINVELSALGKGASVGLKVLKDKIARTQRLVENSVNAVHRFARELRPAVLDDLGLIPALHAYSKNLSERKKINIQMTAFGGVEAMGGAKRTVLFRVAQEALTNVARHANATQVKMSIKEISGAIRMEISDNGRSFQVGKTMLAGNNKRLGLIGMKERVEMVGGSLAINSAPGRGTTVCAEIPFSQVKNAKAKI